MRLVMSRLDVGAAATKVARRAVRPNVRLAKRILISGEGGGEEEFEGWLRWGAMGDGLCGRWGVGKRGVLGRLYRRVMVRCGDIIC
jgi:hypothetical protein